VCTALPDPWHYRTGGRQCRPNFQVFLALIFHRKLGLLLLRFLVHTNDISLCCIMFCCFECLEGFQVVLWDQSHMLASCEFLLAPIHPPLVASPVLQLVWEPVKDFLSLIYSKFMKATWNVVLTRHHSSMGPTTHSGRSICRHILRV
jgi:hypothetical protein